MKFWSDLARRRSFFCATIIIQSVCLATPTAHDNSPRHWVDPRSFSPTAAYPRHYDLPPGRISAEAPLVRPQAARTLVANGDGLGRSGSLGTGQETAITSKIDSLARALKGDPRLLYEFVRNHVRYVPLFGCFKSATQTLVDLRGNDFDQAALLIALLRSSGYSAEFAYGTIRIDAAPITNWLGVEPDAVGFVLGNGGIPATVWVDQQDQLLYVDLDHVWVIASIEGTEYHFDPSFKQHTLFGGIDLEAATGYDRSAFLASATNNATVAADYVQDLNASGIHTTLTQYASALVDEITANHTDASTEEIVGGRRIIAVENALFQTSLPYIQSHDFTWTDVPAQFQTSLRIVFRGIDTTLASCHVYGRRLTIWENDSNQPELRLDGNLIATGNAAAPGSVHAMTLEVNHVYPAFGGTFLDQSLSTSLIAGDRLVLLNGWGGSGRDLVQQHQRQLAQNIADGLAPDSEPVLGGTLSVMASTYLAEETAVYDLVDEVAGTVTLYHHNVGFCGQRSSVFFDLPMQATTVLPKSGGTGSAAFSVQSGIASALEWGVIEQTQPYSAISTVKLIDQANTISAKIFDATAANFIAVVAPELNNYSAFELNTVINYLNAGYRVILPQEGNLGEDSWQGVGFLATHPSGGTAYIIAGGLKGGSGTTIGEGDPYDAMHAGTPPLSEDDHAHSADPVDLVTGSFYYNKTDLSVGSGPFPFEMSFRRRYSSASRLENGPLGLGWTHNFDITAQRDSDPFQGLGEDSAADASAAIAAIMVSSDLLNASQSHLHSTLSLLCHRWLMDQLIDNVAKISMPGSTQLFVKLPDERFYPPPGSASLLTEKVPDYFELTDKHGTVMEFLNNGKISSWTDRNGNTVHFNYTGLVLQSVSNDYGRSFWLGYDSGLIESVYDHTGRLTEFQYDASGNLATVTSADGEVTNYVYDLPGRLVSVHYPLNPALPFVSNVYDAEDRVVTQTDADNNTYQYHCARFRAEEVDPLGHSRILHFDEFGNTLKEVDPIGCVTSMAYDGQGRRTEVIYPELNGTQYAYDERHNPVRVDVIPKPGSGATVETTQYAYEPVYNQVVSETNPAGLTTTYQYDGRGNLTHIVQPLVDGVQPVTQFGNNARGQRVSREDAEGRRIEYQYSVVSADLTLVTTDPGGINLFTAYLYDAVGNRISTHSTFRHKTLFEYDEMRRLMKVIAPPPFEYETYYTYDANGNETVMARETGVLENPWQFAIRSYTNSGNVASITNDIGEATTYEYDEMNRLISSTDAEQQTTSYEYDALGRLHRMIAPTGQMVEEISYTPNGMKASLMDGNNNLTLLGYDPFDRWNRISYPDGSVTALVYDNSGSLTEKTFRNGDRLEYEYDDLLRVRSKEQIGGGIDQTMSYDRTGNVTQVSNSLGAISFTYDAAGRMASKEYPGGRRITYQYEPAGNLGSVIYPSGRAIEYEYDGLNRVTRAEVVDRRSPYESDGDLDGDLSDFAFVQNCFNENCPTADFNNNGFVQLDDLALLVGALTGPSIDLPMTTYQYDALSRRTSSVNDNQTVTTYGFDTAGRMTQLTNYYNGLTQQFDSTYDAIGRRTARTESGFGTETYTYDEASRLEAVNYVDRPDAAWVYDAAGNRDFVVQGGVIDYAVNNLNQYTSIDGDPLTHDAGGNRTGNGDSAYSYNAEKLLTSATLPGVTVTYAHNALGERASKTTSGDTVHYLYDGNQLIAEYGEEGLIVEYFYGPGSDEVLFARRGHESVYYHRDPLGSVVALTDEVGSVIESYRYGAFGETASASPSGNPFRYTGQRFEPETGLYHYKAREYDPDSGRFLQPDPIGFGAGPNLYTYVGNNPVNFVDPLGLAEDVPMRFVFHDPNLPEDEVAEVNRALEGVHEGLDETGRMFFNANWWWNRACVGASETRGELMSTWLDSDWEVRSYTWNSQAHTFNVVIYHDSLGNEHAFHVDNYYSPTWIYQVEDINDVGWYWNTENPTNHGGRPGGNNRSYEPASNPSNVTDPSQSPSSSFTPPGLNIMQHGGL